VENKSVFVIESELQQCRYDTLVLDFRLKSPTYGLRASDTSTAAIQAGCSP